MDWRKFLIKKQDSKDIELLSKQDACAFGVILGFNNIYSIDVDGYFDDNIIYNLLNILGLPLDYEWVIKSGSGIGFHIIFSCDVSDEYKGKTIAYFPNENNRDFCKIELKFEGHSILPLSLHETGGYYTFLNKIPTYSPQAVKSECFKIIIDKYCSYQAEESSLFDGLYHTIRYVAPIDIDLNFIFEKKLREGKYLIISGTSKIISGVSEYSELTYLNQISFLLLDRKLNIVLRKAFNFADNVSLFDSQDESVPLNVSNRIISGSKEDVLLSIHSYINLVKTVVVFNEKEFSSIRLAIDSVLDKRKYTLQYTSDEESSFSYKTRYKSEFIYIDNSNQLDAELHFKTVFNKKINIYSSTIKSYVVYFFLLKNKNISILSDKITSNELWEIKSANGVIFGPNEDNFRAHNLIVKKYLTDNYGYTSGSVKDFIMKESLPFNGCINNLIDIVKEDIKRKRDEREQRYYDEDDYDSREELRQRERDNFDALTDGQYGDFDDLF